MISNIVRIMTGCPLAATIFPISGCLRGRKTLSQSNGGEAPSALMAAPEVTRPSDDTFPDINQETPVGRMKTELLLGDAFAKRPAGEAISIRNGMVGKKEV